MHTADLPASDTDTAKDVQWRRRAWVEAEVMDRIDLYAPRVHLAADIQEFRAELHELLCDPKQKQQRQEVLTETDDEQPAEGPYDTDPRSATAIADSPILRANLSKTIAVLRASRDKHMAAVAFFRLSCAVPKQLWRAVMTGQEDHWLSVSPVEEPTTTPRPCATASAKSGGISLRLWASNYRLRPVFRLPSDYSHLAQAVFFCLLLVLFLFSTQLTRDVRVEKNLCGAAPDDEPAAELFARLLRRFDSCSAGSCDDAMMSSFRFAPSPDQPFADQATGLRFCDAAVHQSQPLAEDDGSVNLACIAPPPLFSARREVPFAGYSPRLRHPVPYFVTQDTEEMIKYPSRRGSELKERLELLVLQVYTARLGADCCTELREDGGDKSQPLPACQSFRELVGRVPAPHIIGSPSSQAGL
jgi:hypothetical protein